MSDFDVCAYNKLSLIATATKRFDTQLNNAGITREDLFSKLALLFQKEANSYYGVCLIHRHYRLRSGERIVRSGNTSSPSTNKSANIVAERWLSTGTEIEYRLTDDISSITPPSSIFFQSFNDILAEYKIDTLGVCYAPASDVVPLLQTAGTGDREQFIRTSSLQGPRVYQSSWDPTSKSCTMACDESFSVRTYNGVRFIADADQAFDEQLDKSPAGPITRDDLFSELAPLFVDDNGKPGPFAVFLVHRHYDVNDGERMVTNGNSTQPSTMTTSDIVPERWFSNGEEFEYRSTADRASLPPSPSADFLAKFKAILDAKGIDLLGVALAPDTSDLAPGFVFLEQPGPGDREQIVTQVPESSARGSDIFQSSWVPTVSETLSLGLSCKHNCQNCLVTPAASQL